MDLVSVHFAKAGGTSIAKALSDHYGETIFWDNGHDPCNAAHDVNDPPVLESRIRAVHGHIRADRYRNCDPRILMTFLREPVDKLLSVYFFWLSLPRHGNPEHDCFITDRPSVVEYARHTAGVAFNAYFGGFDMRDFDFIGFHDRRAEDLSTLSEMAGFPIPHEIHLNATLPSPERAEILGNPALLADLRRALAEDVEFYEKVRADRLGTRA